ncbi:MAG: hypothetical protein L0Z54_00155 [Thermoplasmata archaeon]|nr:hypothetical protein [Thermoplasmata archaeon]
MRCVEMRKDIMEEVEATVAMNREGSMKESATLDRPIRISPIGYWRSQAKGGRSDRGRVTSCTRSS